MAEIDVSDDIATAAGNSTVGFVDAQSKPPRSLGSGTLIRFHGLAGVLTCAHVLEALSKRKTFGIVAFCRGPSRPQSLRIDVAQCEMISIQGEAWTANGPDIGFLILPQVAVEWLGAIATIINGDLRRCSITSDEPTADISFFSVLGGVAEWTTAPVDNETLTITMFNSLSNVGRIQTFAGADGFDFAEFEATPEQSFQLPRSYQGVSGGGLWKFYFNETENGLQFIQARLVGVAYYETDRQTILCHGPRTIYQTLYSRVSTARAA